jgi:hypothetical protein
MPRDHLQTHVHHQKTSSDIMASVAAKAKTWKELPIRSLHSQHVSKSKAEKRIAVKLGIKDAQDNIQEETVRI